METRYHYHLYFEDVASEAFVKVDLEPVSPIRQRRMLNSNPKAVLLQGNVTFVESLAPKIDAWENLQRGAMMGSWLDEYQELLARSNLISSNTIPEVSYPSSVNFPKEEYEYEEIKQSKAIGGMVGGIIAAFFFLGVCAMAFVKRDKLRGIHKKRWVSASKSRTSGLKSWKRRKLPTKNEDDNGTTNAYNGEEVLSFPIASNDNTLAGYPYHLKNTKSNVSHLHDDDDFSLGDVEALAPTPNPGEKMLNKVLALSSFSPLDTSPEILRHHEGDDDTNDCVDESIEVSMYSFSQQYKSDLPSPQFGGRSVIVGSALAANAKKHEDDGNDIMSPMSMGYPETPNVLQALKDAGNEKSECTNEVESPPRVITNTNQERILSPTQSIGNVEVTIDLDRANIHEDTSDSEEVVSINAKRTLLVRKFA